MKFTKKIITMLLVLATTLTCVFVLTGCKGGEEKTEFQKMFDDLGSNFVFEGGEGTNDEMYLYVHEDGMRLSYGAYVPIEDKSNYYYQDMIFRKNDNGKYNLYKSVYKNYGWTMSFEGYVKDETISSSEYKKRINNVLKFLLMPIANYEDSFEVLGEETIEQDGETYHVKGYGAESISYSFKLSGLDCTYIYNDVTISVQNGKMWVVNYTLKQIYNGQTVIGDYYFARNAAEADDIWEVNEDYLITL